VAAADPEWVTYRKFIHHVRGHANHIHVRIGDQPGEPGCSLPQDEDDEDDQFDSEPGDMGPEGELVDDRIPAMLKETLPKSVSVKN
jgi:hypothetical protein